MAEYTVQTPWIVQGQALADLYERAWNASLLETPYYGQNTYVDFSPQTELALGMAQQRALGSSPYEQANQNYLTQALSQGQIDLGYTGALAQYGQDQGAMAYSPLQQTAQGGMLGANPYLDAQFDAASEAVGRRFSESVMPGINATFGGAGRTGSGAHQQAMAGAQNELGSSLGSMAANLYGGAYQQERGLQMQAANQLAGMGLQQSSLLGDLYSGIGEQQARASALMPQAIAAEYGNIDRLGQVGATMQEQANRVLQDDLGRFNYYAGQPLDNLQRYASFIQPGMMGGATSVPEGPGKNRFGTALGGAMTGASLGSAAGPYGALAGGIIGLGAGLFM